MNIDKGSVAYVIVTHDWYASMARANLLEDRPQSESESIMAFIVDADDPYALWLEGADCTHEGLEESLRFAVPWNYVIAVATHPSFGAGKKRRSPGFKVDAPQSPERSRQRKR